MTAYAAQRPQFQFPFQQFEIVEFALQQLQVFQLVLRQFKIVKLPLEQLKILKFVFLREFQILLRRVFFQRAEQARHFKLDRLAAGVRRPLAIHAAAGWTGAERPGAEAEDQPADGLYCRRRHKAAVLLRQQA